MSRRIGLLILILALTLGWVSGASTASSAPSTGSSRSADFNDDGFMDLAIGVPLEDVGTKSNAGGVNVIYGSVNGLAASALFTPSDQFWTQDSSGINDSSEAGDQFGIAVAAGDFDGDGYDDLAIGTNAEVVGSIVDAGSVSVIYGSSGGLASGGDQMWHQDSSAIGGQSETSDFFGQSLTAADFDRDGFTDLAVGVPGEDVGSVSSAGAVNVLYGSTSVGLTSTGNQVWHQDSSGIAGQSETGDVFGRSLTAGDFDGDGFADLGVGAPSEDFGSARDAGAVNVLYGSSSVGLTSAGDQVWVQDSSGILDAVESGDAFGRALSAGDFDDDGFGDLAIGVPFEGVVVEFGTAPNAGSVNVLYGSSSVGLTSVGNQLWHQNRSGIADAAGDGDTFGSAVAAGDFDADGIGDLAVGASGESYDTTRRAGAVHILYGSTPIGLTSASSGFWRQADREPDDQFGDVLVALDFDESYDDLAVGVPNEDTYAPAISRNIADAGRVEVLYGTADGIRLTGKQIWTQNTTAIEDVLEQSDRFGYSLGQ